jgi:hypothetical protein
MISEEKMAHVVHMMLEAIEKAGLVRFPDKGTALREAKRIGNGYLNQFKNAEEAARRRIETQKKPPPEFSQEWDTLYSKYLEEELRKLGG